MEAAQKAGETGRCPPPTSAEHKHWACLKCVIVYERACVCVCDYSVPFVQVICVQMGLK